MGSILIYVMRDGKCFACICASILSRHSMCFCMYGVIYSDVTCDLFFVVHLWSYDVAALFAPEMMWPLPR